MTLNFRGVSSIHINPSEFGEFVMKSALFEGIKLDTQIGGFMSCNKKSMYIYIYAYKYFFAVWQKKLVHFCGYCSFVMFLLLFLFLSNELKHPRLPWRWLTMQTKQMEPNGLESAASTRDGADIPHKNWVVASQRFFMFTLSWGRWSNFD